MAKEKASKGKVTRKNTEATQLPKRSTKKRYKNRREREKYPALDVGLNLKSRTESIDYDYVNKLSDKDKAWLNKFTEEFVNASFDTTNTRRNLHKSKEGRRDCYNRNNARNRDVLTKQKASSRNTYLEDIPDIGRENMQVLEAKMDLDMLGYIGDDGDFTEAALELLENIKQDTKRGGKTANNRRKKHT